jgi:acetyltransferase
VLPSILTAKEEVEDFLSKGRVNFPDEAVLGQALCKVFATPPPAPETMDTPEINQKEIRRIIDENDNGYLNPEALGQILDAAGIPRAGEAVVKTAEEAVEKAVELGLPVVMKVVGPVHKSDVGGVVLGVKTELQVKAEFERMIQIKDTHAILIQPMLSGTELFAGVKFEPKFGHLILCGMGGIFIEVLKDVSAYLAPLSRDDAHTMIQSLKSYKIIQGVRGQKGIDEDKFADLIVRLSALVMAAPEIAELDLNPLLGNEKHLTAVDARLRIEK